MDSALRHAFSYLEGRPSEAVEQLEDRDFAAPGSALQSIIEWIIKGADFTKPGADAHGLFRKRNNRPRPQ
jgi:hypothetical protein